VSQSENAQDRESEDHVDKCQDKKQKYQYPKDECFALLLGRLLQRVGGHEVSPETNQQKRVHFKLYSHTTI
jgi:hypothetical protein